MRITALLPVLLLAAACTNTPDASVPEAPAAPGAPAAADDGAADDARCPAPTEPCMNEDNHAQCLTIAASCAGEILQLESCPLQFACSDGG